MDSQILQAIIQDNRHNPIELAIWSRGVNGYNIDNNGKMVSNGKC